MGIRSAIFDAMRNRKGEEQRSQSKSSCFQSVGGNIVIERLLIFTFI